VVRYEAKSLHREFGVRFRLLGQLQGTPSHTVRYNPTVSLLFLQRGMKEIPESTYEDCFKKFLCARTAGRVALRRRTQGSARLIIKLDIPSRNFRRTCSASAGSAASPKALFIKRIHRIAGSLIYMERRMPRAEAWLASLFDVSLRPSEPAD